MIMPLVANTRRKYAAQYPVLEILMQLFAHRLTLPSCLKGIR